MYTPHYDSLLLNSKNKLNFSNLLTIGISFWICLIAALLINTIVTIYPWQTFLTTSYHQLFDTAFLVIGLISTLLISKKIDLKNHLVFAIVNGFIYAILIGIFTKIVYGDINFAFFIKNLLVSGLFIFILLKFIQEEEIDEALFFSFSFASCLNFILTGFIFNFQMDSPVRFWSTLIACVIFFSSGYLFTLMYKWLNPILAKSFTSHANTSTPSYPEPMSKPVEKESEIKLPKPSNSNVKSGKPAYVKTDYNGDSTYKIYSSNNAESAKEFLLTQVVIEAQYYIVVETPEGNWGMDKEGLYLERLLSWQSDLYKATDTGYICNPPTTFALKYAAQGFNDNFVAKVSCKKCNHEWYDGFKYQSSTVVKCPSCKTYLEVNSKNFSAILY